MKPETDPLISSITRGLVAFTDIARGMAEVEKPDPDLDAIEQAAVRLATPPLLEEPALKFSRDLERAAQRFQKQQDEMTAAVARLDEEFSDLRAVPEWVMEYDALIRANAKATEEMAARTAWLDGISEFVSQAKNSESRRFERNLTRHLRHLPRSIADFVRDGIPRCTLPKTREGLRVFIAHRVKKILLDIGELPPCPRRAAQADCARALAWLEGIQKRIERAAVRLLTRALSAFTHPAGEHGGDGSTLPDLLSRWRPSEQRGPPDLVGDLMRTAALSFGRIRPTGRVAIA